MPLKVSVPIYYTIERKTKKSSTHLVGDNWVRNLHYHTKNTVKQHYHITITSSITPPPSPYKQFTLSFQIYYKNASCDPSNILHQMEKYALDAFKASGCIIDDNCKHHMGTTMLPPIKDASNPRCDIILSEYSL